MTLIKRLEKIGVRGIKNGMIVHAYVRCKPDDPWRLVIGSAEHGEVYWSGNGAPEARITKANAPPDHTGHATVEFDISKFRLSWKLDRAPGVAA